MKLLIQLFLCCPFLCWSQLRPEILEDKLKEQSGFEKLTTLNELTSHYQDSNERKFRKYARQGYVLAENFEKSNLDFTVEQSAAVVQALNLFGISQYERKNYLDAKGVFQKAQLLSRQSKNAGEAAKAESYLTKIDSLLDGSIKENFFTRKLTDLNIGNMVSNTNNDVGIALELKMARISESKNDTFKTISHYTKAADLLRDKGEFEKAEEIEGKIASYRKTKKLETQLKLLQPIAGPASSTQSVDTIHETQREASTLLNQAAQLEANNDYEAALAYYKQYTALQRRLEQDSLERERQRAIVVLEMDRLKQENEIADLSIATIQLEKEAEIRAKKALFVGLALIAVAAIATLILYISKRKKHHQLTKAFKDLDEAKEALQDAKVRISRLLEQQVSPEIASALIEDAPEKRKQYVAIMFVDIRGFTPIAEKMEPNELIEYQNNIFGFMIEVIQQYRGNINQFMGDGFMATFGAPKSHGDDVKNSFLAGKEIIAQLDQLNKKGIVPYTRVGIGIHAGNVVTGNVGTDSRKQFSVTGNTVIIAARIEQLNKKYSSSMIISQEVFEYLDANDTEEMNLAPYEASIKGRTEPIKILVYNGKALDSSELET